MTKLERYISNRGISRCRLSRMTGLSRRTISQLCDGRSNGRMDTWRLIARALGCRLEEIIDA